MFCSSYKKSALVCYTVHIYILLIETKLLGGLWYFLKLFQIILEFLLFYIFQ